MTLSESFPRRTAAAATSPEAALLLDTIDADAGPSAVTARLLRADLDWTPLVRAALAQRLIAPLATRLAGVGEPLLPDDIAYALRFRVETNSQRNAQLLETVAELAPALAQHFIDGLFFDGPTLALQAFGSLSRRDPVAPHVLVQSGQLEAADRLLTELGFRLSRPEPQDAAGGDDAVSYRRAADEASVYVCTQVARRSTGVCLDHGALFLRAETMIDCEGSPRTPCAADSLLLTAVRAGTKGWCALGAACDVAGLLRSLSELDLVRLRQRAQRQRCGRMLELALLVAGKSTADIAVRALGRDLCARTLAADGPTHRRLGVDRFQWQLRDHWHERLRYAAYARFAKDHADAAPPAGSDSAAPVSAQQAKARNENHWGNRSQSWERWAESGRSSAAEFNRALLSAVGAAPGRRILDLACGVGDTALEVAPVVGAEGFVAATDLAFDMVSKAHRRALGSRFHNLQCCALDMERLPFKGASFDGIVSRLGIMYAPHPAQALQEARRVLRPGGRAAYLVCGPRIDNPILRIVHDVVTELFALNKYDAAIQPFRFGEKGSLARVMERAGFALVQETSLELIHHVPAGTRFWQASLERGLGMPLELLPPLTLAELEHRMTEAFTPYLRGRNYRLPSVSHVTVGVSG